MLKISPIVVVASLVVVLGCFLLSFRNRWLGIGLSIIAASIFFTTFLLYLEEQYLSLLLK